MNQSKAVMDLLEKMNAGFADYVNKGMLRLEFFTDTEFTRYEYCHSIVLGLIARVGLELGYDLFIERALPLNPPLVKQNGRKSWQARPDLLYATRHGSSRQYSPIILIDFDSLDAPIDSMKRKAQLFKHFPRDNPEITIYCYIITLTRASSQWEPLLQSRVGILPSLKATLSNTASQHKTKDFLLGVINETGLTWYGWKGESAWELPCFRLWKTTSR